MEVVYRKLSDLVPNPKNPRKGSQEAIEKLAESFPNLHFGGRLGMFQYMDMDDAIESALLLAKKT